MSIDTDARGKALRDPDSFRKPGSADRSRTIDDAGTAQQELAARGQGGSGARADAALEPQGSERPPEPVEPEPEQVRRWRARPLSRSGRRAVATARGLGWFSIALGLAEVLMPRMIARTLGLSNPAMVRFYGVREIATGVAILAADDPTPWIGARMAGDALDMATLVPALQPGAPRRGSAIAAVATVASVTAVDAATTAALRAERRRQAEPVYDYSDRSGFPKPAHEMRGAALADFEMPRDMRGPEALRPLS